MIGGPRPSNVSSLKSRPTEKMEQNFQQAMVPVKQKQSCRDYEQLNALYDFLQDDETSIAQSVR